MFRDVATVCSWLHNNEILINLKRGGGTGNCIEN